MEEKKVTKISLSTFLLILAIIAIVVMGVFIYKLNNDKTIEIQKSSELQAQINSLSTTVNNLKETVNNSTNSNIENEVSNEKITNADNNTKNQNEKMNQEKIIIPEANTNLSKTEEKLIEYFRGLWFLDKENKILVIDYGKRFCEMNFDGSNKEYGTFILEEKNDYEYYIELTYNSGKKEKLMYVEGSGAYLETDNREKIYSELNKYYFGSEGDDEGIFSKK